jgi:iron complex outermembrane receptor protein
VPLACGLLFTASAAFAADPPAAAGESESGLAEVLVTAQFRTENVQDTPIAITALNADALSERNLSNVAEAASHAPNVFIAPAAQGFGQSASIIIRGIGQADPHFAVEPGVGMYIDDVYYGILTGSMLELLDLDRVEVLRGPQGTLAGKNSIGGAIKLFSQKPGPEADSYVEVGYGRFDRVLGRAATNLTLVPDKLFARVSAATLHQDGYLTQLDYTCATGQALDLGPGLGGTQRLTTGCKIGEEGGKDVWTVRGALRWVINDKIENNLVVDATEDHSQNPAGKLLLQSPAWAQGANFITGAESYTNYETNQSRPTGAQPSNDPYAMPKVSPLDASGISNNLDIALSDTLQLESITGYRAATTQFSQQADASPASIVDQLWRLRHHQFTQELRLSGTVGTLVDWTVGAFYYDAEGYSSGRINLPGGLQPGGGGLNLEIILDDPVKTRSESAFVHSVFHVTDRLNLTAAVRYTDDLKEFTFNRRDSNLNPPLLGLLDFTGTYEGNRLDYRAAVDYRWTDNFMTFAQVSTGYKGGGVNPRPFFVTQVRNYDPETLRTYEAGFKSDLFERRARLNTSVYYSNYKDIQLMLNRCDQFSPFPGAPCAMSANVGDAHVKGAELELQLLPTDQLSIDAAVGYTDFEYTRIGPNVAVTRDMTTVYAPKTTATAGVQYRFELGGIGSITPRIDYAYRSKLHGGGQRGHQPHRWRRACECTPRLEERYE